MRYPRRLIPPSALPKCAGWLLLRWGRWRLELWRCPAGEKIPPHVHQQVTSRFIFLNRNLVVHRAGSLKAAPLPWLRFYMVKPGQAHWAEAVYGAGWFLNLEHWVGPWPAKSAAEDFVA